MLQNLKKLIFGLTVFVVPISCILSYETAPCDENKKWQDPPPLETDGYVDSSLVKMLEFVRWLNQPNTKYKLKLHECIALSLFAEAYRPNAEPCAKRSLGYIRRYIEFCAKKWWFDPYTYSFGIQCAIFGVNPFNSAAPLFFDALFEDQPECKIGTAYDFREKVEMDDIEKAVQFIENPKLIPVKEEPDKIPDCGQIRNPSFWIKFKKLPKNPYRAVIAYGISKKATRKAKELYSKNNTSNCNTLHNGAGDAFRHCYWTCLMTRELGEHTALDYSDYHEFSDANPCDEAIMDYTNNRIGVKIANASSDCEKECKNNKDLVIIKEDAKCF
ncbi:MAG: hypothetical protein V1647_06930 [Pseudomonadota bacterium]